MSDVTPPPPAEDPGDNDGSDDCFKPPAIPCQCYCLHCNRTFQSDRMWFQKVLRGGGKVDGFWLCPTPNCDGAGFTMDIFPTDPGHEANAGWSDDGGDEADEMFDPEGQHEEEETAEEYDPAEPAYAATDGWDDDDDLEGEEWKHGLEPGQRPPETPWAAEAREHYEAEQAKFDGPDERPRVLDLSHLPEPRPISEDDIPF